MANGRVCTGFSKPYVAVYTASGTTVTYSNGQILARGVDVSISPESSDDNIFYADNVAAEVAGSRFTGGEVTLTVDGLLDAAEKLIYGLPAAEQITVGTDTVDVYNYGDEMTPPYVGIGFIARYLSDGVESFVPYVLTKTRFQIHEDSAATQEEDIEFQTQSLTATILRDDTANHNWKKVAEEQDTEADALAVIEEILG